MVVSVGVVWGWGGGFEEGPSLEVGSASGDGVAAVLVGGLVDGEPVRRRRSLRGGWGTEERSRISAAMPLTTTPGRDATRTGLSAACGGTASPWHFAGYSS